MLEEIYGEIPDNEKVLFVKNKAQTQFNKFLKFVKGKSMDDLEIIVYLHYLKNAQTESDDDEIIQKITNKQDRFELV